MNNIAEGFGRFSDKEFIRFLEVSLTSAMEVKGCLYVASDLNYCDEIKVTELQDRAEEVKKLNLALIRYLSRKKR